MSQKVRTHSLWEWENARGSRRETLCTSHLQPVRGTAPAQFVLRIPPPPTNRELQARGAQERGTRLGVQNWAKVWPFCCFLTNMSRITGLRGEKWVIVPLPSPSGAFSSRTCSQWKPGFWAPAQVPFPPFCSLRQGKSRTLPTSLLQASLPPSLS